MTGLITYLQPASINLNLALTSKTEAMEAMIDLIDAGNAITDRAAFTQALWDREAQYVTALGDQIAIPHGKSTGISKPALAFARSEGVDWRAQDGQPVRLLFMIAVPAADAGTEHLVILAKLARALVKAPLRQALLTAQTPDQVIQILGDATN